MHTPVTASPDHSRRSFDSDEELGRNTVGGQDWEFLVGTAISVYQNSGGGGNNWSEFENQTTRFGQPTIEVGHQLLLQLSNGCLAGCGCSQLVVGGC